MAVIEIKEDGIVLARHIRAEDAWSGDLQFFSSDEEYVQVGTWGYDEGKKLLAHTHNEVKREVYWTQEVLYVRNGRIKAYIYNSKEKLVSYLTVNKGDLIILFRGGHGYDILDNGTQVLEVKNGPYVGANADRRRL